LTLDSPASHCLALDLKDDPKLIAECRKDEKIWLEITETIRKAGIVDMEIYLVGNRLFMITEVNEGFSLKERPKQTRRIRKFRNGSN
jgi:L-rhamnose mutarotase